MGSRQAGKQSMTGSRHPRLTRLFLRGTQCQASPARIHPGGLVLGQAALVTRLGQPLALLEAATSHSTPQLASSPLLS